MVQQLLSLLPQALMTANALLCIALLAAGLMLWLVGAAWGRAILTLIAVALGATLGLLVPRWQMWPINSMSTAVLGAVCFGVSAFLVERVWSGLLLGAVLVAWTTLAVWMQLGADQSIEIRSGAEVEHLTPLQHVHESWTRLPEAVRRVLPYAAATALISAMAIALLWPRVAKVFAFSTLGVTILLLAALMLTASRHPDWLLLVPEQSSVQAAVLGAMVLLGAVVQWQLLPRGRRTGEESAQPQEKKIEEPSTSDLSRGRFV